ncbi:MAG: DUF5715 family protein [Muribaculaceae bacterium]
MKTLIYGILAVILLLLAACSGVCGLSEYTPPSAPPDSAPKMAELLNPTPDSFEDIPEYAQDEIEDDEREPDSTDVADDEVTGEERVIPIDSMPPGGEKLQVRMLGSLRKVFNDSNYKHLRVAELNGIRPINKVSDAWHLNQPIVRIEATETYYVDELTYSLPYLVPRAKTLLDDISRTWRDSLTARGGGDYRLKVTSLLRTPATIAKLKRRNRAAVDASAHQYGTTFDISFVKFVCDNPENPRTAEDLKNLLAEVLYELREDGRCYVKYEHKQGCFHITVR